MKAGIFFWRKKKDEEGLVVANAQHQLGAPGGAPIGGGPAPSRVSLSLSQLSAALFSLGIILAPREAVATAAGVLGGAFSVVTGHASSSLSKREIEKAPIVTGIRLGAGILIAAILTYSVVIPIITNLGILIFPSLGNTIAGTALNPAHILAILTIALIEKKEGVDLGKFCTRVFCMNAVVQYGIPAAILPMAAYKITEIMLTI